MEKIFNDILITYYDAFKNKNWICFSSILTDDFTYFTDKGVVQSKNDFIDFLSKADFVTSNYIMSDLRIISKDNQLSVLSYMILFNGAFQHQSMQVKATETTVFEFINHSWKIKHCHTSNF